MAHEVGQIICSTHASFQVDDIKVVKAVTDFVEDDDPSKDLKIFLGKFCSKEELPNGKVKTKNFQAWVQGSDIEDALTNMKLYLKTFIMDTKMLGITEIDLMDMYTADDIRDMKSNSAAA